MSDLPSREREPSTEAKTAEEMARIPYEPLLPIEKTLIVGSLVLGALLLGLLLWLGSTYFPVTGE
jgi:hypothetical protein